MLLWIQVYANLPRTPTPGMVNCSSTVKTKTDDIQPLCRYPAMCELNMR